MDSRIDSPAAQKQRSRNIRFAPIIPDRVPWRGVVVFTVLAIGLAWAVASPLWISGDGLAHPQFGLIALAMMYTPAIAAFVVVLFVARPKSIPRVLGLAPIRPWGRTLALCGIAFVGFPVLAFASMLLGDALGLIELDFAGLSGLAAVLEATGVEVAGREQLIGIATVQTLLIPVVILGNCVATFGEEIGWRGWLLPNLLPLGTWPALVVSGVVWGVWHAPLILLGHNYGRTDILGLLLMIGWCVLLGTLIGWLRLRSASVWPAVVAHAAVNGSVSALLAFAAADSFVTGTFGTFLGWSGWILLAVVILLLAVTGQFGKRAKPGLTLSESARSVPAPTEPAGLLPAEHSATPAASDDTGTPTSTVTETRG